MYFEESKTEYIGNIIYPGSEVNISSLASFILATNTGQNKKSSKKLYYVGLILAGATKTIQILTKSALPGFPQIVRVPNGDRN